ncbi:RagB/SusD family nutrient uptake outer membrane protein [Prolixibacteraceae bacterium JC049]|nr:RagB/SusD family nutrient uptake outer membrane protein [Prolixibacteraceae bacterium JC049]
MKKYLLLYTFIFALFTGCEDDVLNKLPENKYSDATVWSNPDLIQLYVNQLYSAWEMNTSNYYDYLSDDLCPSTKSSTYLNINQDLIDNTFNAGWNFTKIRVANKVIANLTENTTFDQDQKDFLLGQAYYFRGTYYFELVKKFGGVVLLDKPLDASDDLNLSRASDESSWEFVINDFKKAASLLENNVGQKTRVTKGACLAMQMRSELYAGKYEDVKTTYNIIKNLGYGLHDTYGPIWKDPTTWKTSVEVLAGMEYVLKEKNNGWTSAHMTQSYDSDLSGGGGGGVSFNHTQIYYVIDEDGVARSWDESNHKQNTNVADGVYQYLYGNREVRFNENVLSDGETVMGYTFEFNVGGKNSGQSQFDPPMFHSHVSHVNTGNMIQKFMGDDPQYVPHTQKNCDLPSIVIRYAEVLLNYAEACIMLNDLDEARAVINRIRTRAQIPILETNENLKEEYKLERRKEMAFEGHRYWDLLRWAKQEGNTMINELNTRLKWLCINSDRTAFVVVDSDGPKWNRVWNPRRFLWPIPFSEIEYNPNLIQNPGW